MAAIIIVFCANEAFGKKVYFSVELIVSGVSVPLPNAIWSSIGVRSLVDCVRLMMTWIVSLAHCLGHLPRSTIDGGAECDVFGFRYCTFGYDATAGLVKRGRLISHRQYSSRCRWNGWNWTRQWTRHNCHRIWCHFTIGIFDKTLKSLMKRIKVVLTIPSAFSHCVHHSACMATWSHHMCLDHCSTWRSSTVLAGRW